MLILHGILHALTRTLSLPPPPAGTWDTSKVTNFFGVFDGAFSFNQPLDWDTRAAVSIRSCFSNAVRFNDPSVGFWNTSGVNDLGWVFQNSTFDQPLFWDLGNAQNLEGAFANARFNQPLAGLSLASATDLDWLFYNNSHFSQDLSSLGGALGGRAISADSTFSLASGLTDCDKLRIASTWPSTIWSPYQPAWDSLSPMATGQSTISGGRRAMLAPDAIAWDADWGAWAASNVDACATVVEWEDIVAAFGDSDGGGTYDAQLLQTWLADLGLTTYWAGDGGVWEAFVKYQGNQLRPWDDSAAWFMSSFGGVEPESYSETADLHDWVLALGNYAVIRPLLVSVPDDRAFVATDDTMHASVKAWVSNAAAAEAIYGNISSFDTGAVTDMAWLFCGDTGRNDAWEHYIFGGNNVTVPCNEGAQSFNLDITSWNTSAVVSMRDMFTGALAFNQPIGSWDTSAVANMVGMFNSASSFNQPLNSFDTRSLQYASWVFKAASSFNQPLSSWDMSKVIKIHNIFDSATAFNSPVSGWNLSSCTDMHEAFRNATYFNMPVQGWDTSSVTTMQGMFRDAAAFDQPIGSWVTSKVETVRMMFLGAVSFNQQLVSWDLSSCTDMAGMFNYALSFNQRIDAWDTARVTDMSWLFYRAAAYNQPIDGLNTSSVLTMYNMFAETVAFNQRIDAWDTARVTNMVEMFMDAAAFDKDISAWNVGAVTSSADTFSGATSLSACNKLRIASTWPSTIWSPYQPAWDSLSPLGDGESTMDATRMQALSLSQYNETADISSEAKSRFGPCAAVVEWNDIQDFYDAFGPRALSAWMDGLALPDAKDTSLGNAWVLYNGEQNYQGTSYAHYLSRFDGEEPTRWSYNDLENINDWQVRR